ncbi:MAG TPA: NUDIX hydrolase [Umezawaea sp.]|nr:NUDIX hydrolase [Umezawaea sp.]
MSIKTVTSRLVYENAWLSVREDQVEHLDGTPGIYSVVDKPDFAVIIPAENDGFHLVEQHRYPTGERSWEFPSGSFPQGKTGTEEELAAAELAEETGFTAGNLKKLGFLHLANAFTPSGFHVYLATNLTPGEPHREPTEQDMRQQWFPRSEVVHMLRTGTLKDGPTAAAYLLLTLHE